MKRPVFGKLFMQIWQKGNLTKGANGDIQVGAMEGEAMQNEVGDSIPTCLPACSLYSSQCLLDEVLAWPRACFWHKRWHTDNNTARICVHCLVSCKPWLPNVCLDEIFCMFARRQVPPGIPYSRPGPTSRLSTPALECIMGPMNLAIISPGRICHDWLSKRS